jgi:hypothetical protein
MGFRFRRSVRVIPGIRVNVSKSGITSVSVGRRGITTNINSKGIRTTFSVRGTGISYSTDRSGWDANSGNRSIGGRSGALAVALFVAVAALAIALR